MKKIWILSLFACSLLLFGCTPMSTNEKKDDGTLIFSWNLREDYELSYNLKVSPEWSGRRYTININPIDEWYTWDKQPQTISFLSDIKIDKIIESHENELYPEEKSIIAPELWLKISWDRIELDENFWLYCPWRDWDEFIMIPGWSGNLPNWRDIELCDNDKCRNYWGEYDAYQFMWPVKYINHYKRWDIAMFFEWNERDWLRIDDSELFSKNCMIEIWEIEDFLPLSLPFELNFNNFEYTTLWFIRELWEDSNCLSSHKEFNPHNNYMSFFTEDLACQLWYESWTTLESITFENNNKYSQSFDFNE